MTQTRLLLMKVLKGMTKQKVQEMKLWILFFEPSKNTELTVLGNFRIVVDFGSV